MKNKEFAEALLSILPEDIKSELVARLVPTPGKWVLKFTDIKTFNDACKACGTSEEEFYLEWSDRLLPSDTFAYEQLKLIVKAINQGWTPDWNDTNQRKWWPYFNLSSGFGFSHSYSYYGYAPAAAGSRLCFQTEEKSNYAANQFTELYKEFISITK
jgi:hypothetical protein